MNKESKILHHIAVAVALVAVIISSGCRKRGILSKNDVADIMYQMFVADEYAKKYPNVSKAADSLLLYQHIFDKYDCSLEDYRNSIKHYIVDEKAYTYILKRAVQTAKDSANQANRETGITTFVIVWASVAPRSRLASTIEKSNSSRRAFTIRKTKGRQKVVWAAKTVKSPSGNFTPLKKITMEIPMMISGRTIGR